MSMKRKTPATDEDSVEGIPESLPKKKPTVDHFQQVVVCEICTENKQSHEMIKLTNCSHSFCSDCIAKYVTMKIEANPIIGPSITCPMGSDCNGVMEFEAYRTVIPKEVSDRWDDKLTESLIDISQRFYCPFKDCSVMLVKDGCIDGEIIRESECPKCHRLFCAECRVPWHPSIACEEFQSLNEDERGINDLMVRDLARANNWKRCPHCRFYVDKTDGCEIVRCRCGKPFRYV